MKMILEYGVQSDKFYPLLDTRRETETSNVGISLFELLNEIGHLLTNVQLLKDQSYQDLILSISVVEDDQEGK